jgi:hypothetical protein
MIEFLFSKAELTESTLFAVGFAVPLIVSTVITERSSQKVAGARSDWRSFARAIAQPLSKRRIFLQFRDQCANPQRRLL